MITVIADDFTGANATAALLARLGLRVFSVLPDIRVAGTVPDDTFDFPGRDETDVVVLATRSRTTNPEVSYHTVFDCARKALRAGAWLIAKRIDSTLRGNVSDEIRAVVDALPGAVVVVAPAYPVSGRVVVGGYELVDGVPLHATAAGRDPTRPVTTSYVPNILAATGIHVVQVTLDQVTSGPDSVAVALKDAACSGSRLVLCDATSDADIRVVAEAIAMSGLNIVPVDPGPLTAEVVRQVVLRRKPLPAGLLGGASGMKAPLIVAGSTTDLTRRQLTHLVAEKRAEIVPCDPGKLLCQGPVREEETARVVREVSSLLGRGTPCGVTSATSAGQIIDPGPAGTISRAIAESLADIALGVLSVCMPRVAGIVVTGGDVLAAVVKRLGAWAVDVRGEVLPLAAAGRLLGGTFDGLPVVSKGGLVGDETALAKCADYLSAVASFERTPARERKMTQ